MIDTKEQYEKALAPLKWGAPDSAKAIMETIEALREVARATFYLLNTDYPAWYSYDIVDETLNALPDWLTE